MTALAVPETSPAATETASLFQQGWWLDAVAPGRWAAVRVDRDGETVGFLPYLVESFGGLRWSRQPALTPALGPWVRREGGTYRRALMREHEIVRELLDRLPRLAHFYQRCSPALTNGLPFIWAGFDVRVRYTYRLSELDDLDRVWHGFEEQRRRAVRKAQRTLEVLESDELEPLLRLSRRAFERSRVAMPYDEALVRRIDAACRTRGAATFLLARDAAGRLHAGVYLVHDAGTAYYLLGGHEDWARTNGAVTLLLWEAIRRVASTGGVFDFEGSMIPSVERFFRSFGARQVPYLEVSRTTAGARPLLAAARLVRRTAGGRR